jgi:hypothetical protein
MKFGTAGWEAGYPTTFADPTFADNEFFLGYIFEWVNKIEKILLYRRALKLKC